MIDFILAILQRTGEFITIEMNKSIFNFNKDFILVLSKLTKEEVSRVYIS